jgi:hypothetical protein
MTCGDVSEKTEPLKKHPWYRHTVTLPIPIVRKEIPVIYDYKPKRV